MGEISMLQLMISCGSYLFSVSFMMMVPRVENTMKDIRSMGLQNSVVEKSTMTNEHNVHML